MKLNISVNALVIVLNSFKSMTHSVAQIRALCREPCSNQWNSIKSAAVFFNVSSNARDYTWSVMQLMQCIIHVFLFLKIHTRLTIFLAKSKLMKYIIHEINCNSKNSTFCIKIDFLQFVFHTDKLHTSYME